MVHHGGAGTVHAAALAGCPMLCLPLFGDQFMWAARAARLGLGPDAITLAQARDGRKLAQVRCAGTELFRWPSTLHQYASAGGVMLRFVAQGLARLTGEPAFCAAAAALADRMRREEPGLDALERRIAEQLRDAPAGVGGSGDGAWEDPRPAPSGRDGHRSSGEAAGAAGGSGEGRRRRVSAAAGCASVGGWRVGTGGAPGAGAGRRTWDWQEVLVQLCRYWYG